VGHGPGLAGHRDIEGREAALTAVPGAVQDMPAQMPAGLPSWTGGRTQEETYP